MKKIINLILILMVVACGPMIDIIGSDNVLELNNVVLTVTEMEATDWQWKVRGTIVNTGDTTIVAPWHIEAMFYSDDTFTETFGGDNDRINFDLEPGVTSHWTLDYSSNAVTESDYPNFAIKDLRAFVTYIR